jgi:hypothetical protein
MTKKTVIEDDTLNLKAEINSKGIVISSEGRVLADLKSDEIRPVINMLSYLIDEDIPGMIEKGDWDTSNYEIEIKCQVPLQPMLLRD